MVERARETATPPSHKLGDMPSQIPRRSCACMRWCLPSCCFSTKLFTASVSEAKVLLSLSEREMTGGCSGAGCLARQVRISHSTKMSGYSRHFRRWNSSQMMLVNASCAAEVRPARFVVLQDALGSQANTLAICTLNEGVSFRIGAWKRLFRALESWSRSS